MAQTCLPSNAVNSVLFTNYNVFGVSYVCNDQEHFFQCNPENGVAILMAPPGTTVNSLSEQAKLGHRSSDCLDFPSVFQPR